MYQMHEGWRDGYSGAADAVAAVADGRMPEWVWISSVQIASACMPLLEGVSPSERAAKIAGLAASVSKRLERGIPVGRMRYSQEENALLARLALEDKGLTRQTCSAVERYFEDGFGSDLDNLIQLGHSGDATYRTVKGIGRKGWQELLDAFPRR